MGLGRNEWHACVRISARGVTRVRAQATASITSVPKPLKFLRPHWEPLEVFYKKMMDDKNKNVLADILSCLAMTMAEEVFRPRSGIYPSPPPLCPQHV